MTILSQLSSQLGTRNQAANEAVAAQLLAIPELMPEVAAGLQSTKADLLGDAAEVMTMVAQRQPALVAPYAEALAALLGHKTTRVRWEAMHALALVAHLVPVQIIALLPKLDAILRSDKSIIVRDYAIDALGGAAKADAATAQQLYPLLKEAAYLWESRHVGHALTGLAQVVTSAPALAAEIAPIGQAFADHPKGVVRKAAKALLKAISK